MAFARREVLAGTVAGIALHSARIQATTAASGSIRVDEGTNVALTLSPDGQAIAIDLYGVLWRLPASGGRLQRLTGDDDDIGQPQWSPDGQKIAMQSYRDGNFRIWAVPAMGGPMQRMTPPGGTHDEREPCWSPDGRMLAFSSDSEAGRYAIHILDVASGAVRMFSPGSGEHSEPAWSPDGRTIAFVEDGSRIVLAPLAGGSVRTVAAIAGSTDPFHPKALRAPAFAPDGTLHYSRLDDHGVSLVAGGHDVIVGEDLYPFRPAWTRTGLLYASGGKIRHRTAAATRIVPFETEIAIPHAERPRRSTLPTGEWSVRGIVAPALSPDGRRVVFGALNDLWLMTIGRSPERRVSGDFHKTKGRAVRAAPERLSETP